MRKNLPIIAFVLVCVLLLFCLLQIKGLREEVSSLRKRMDDGMERVNSNVFSIYDEVRSILEEEASLLSVSEWEYGKIDEEARTVEILCTIVPKIHTPGVTTAALVCDGKETPMAFSGGQYTAVIQMPLFTGGHIQQVMFNDAGTIRTEALDWNIEPRHETLPISYAGATGTAKGTPGESAYTWAVDYSVHISVEGKHPFEIRSVEVVEMLDGKEIGRLPVDISEAGQKAYEQELSSAVYPLPEAAGEVTYSNGVVVKYEGHNSFLYTLNKEYQIPNGSELILYVDVVDGNGLRYRSFAEGKAIGTDGQPDDERIDEMHLFDFAEPIWVFDEKGNVLYTIAEEYFR